MSVMRARFEAQVCEPKACVLCSLYIIMRVLQQLASV